jgi:hypothetical protein
MGNSHGFARENYTGENIRKEGCFLVGTLTTANGAQRESRIHLCQLGYFKSQRISCAQMHQATLQTDGRTLVGERFGSVNLRNWIGNIDGRFEGEEYGVSYTSHRAGTSDNPVTITAQGSKYPSVIGS